MQLTAIQSVAEKSIVAQAAIAGPRTAVVHEWLETYAGAERALEQILVATRAHDLFAIVDFMPDSVRADSTLPAAHTSFIQNIPGARKYFRKLLWLMPLAVEQLDVSQFDIVISSNHAVAKGVITGPDQLHISYVYTPMRYAWDMQNRYLNAAGLGRGMTSLLARYMLRRLRRWDVQSANGVDSFVAISHYIARRILKAYGRWAAVIYPPVAIDQFSSTETKDSYYLCVSRMVPYKRIDLIVDAFSRMPQRKLLVIGDGPEMNAMKRKAAEFRNIELLGNQKQPEMVDYMKRAKAFVYAAEEDFGIAMAEAQACGTPVISFDRGGAAEIVRGLDREAPTGVLFDRQSAESIIKAVEDFERLGDRISPGNCRKNAERFGNQRFQKEFVEFVSREWERFQQNRRAVN